MDTENSNNENLDTNNLDIWMSSHMSVWTSELMLFVYNVHTFEFMFLEIFELSNFWISWCFECMEHQHMIVMEIRALRSQSPNFKRFCWLLKRSLPTSINNFESFTKRIYPKIKLTSNEIEQLQRMKFRIFNRYTESHNKTHLA